MSMREDKARGLRFHSGMTCDLSGTLKLPDDELETYFTDDGKPVPPAAAREKLRAWIAMGYEVMPICDNPDARGWCAGHPIEPEPVELRFCEPHKLVDQLRKLKALGLSREMLDSVSRPIVNLMTRGFIYHSACDNTDQHGLCLGHPVDPT